MDEVEVRNLENRLGPVGGLRDLPFLIDEFKRIAVPITSKGFWSARAR